MIFSKMHPYGQSIIRNLSNRSIFSNFSSVSSSSSKVNITSRPIVELREYELHPSQAVSYVQHTTEGSDLRKSLTPLRMFSIPETGGKLNVATHLYYFQGGFEERNNRRAKMGQSNDWKSYLKNVRPCMISQKSNIFVEAPLVMEMKDEICGLSPGRAEEMLNMYEDIDGAKGMLNPECIIEYRRYQLKLGYDTVPKFMDLYAEGLPSKLNASGTDSTTSLISLLYSEVGQLNEVIEIWRHGSTSAMEISRNASRSSNKWRDSIANIANLTNIFTNTIHKPLTFSPIR